MNKTKEQGYRLTTGNLVAYLKKEYGSNDVKLAKAKSISGVKPLLQNDYGKSNDCALVSIVTLLNYELKGKHRIEMIYQYVEDVAKKYGYDGDKFGTANIFIRSILAQAAKSFRVKKTASSKYIKQLGYDWKGLYNQIDSKHPTILCITDDGREYYKSHAVLAIGASEYRLADKDDRRIHIIHVYDNWHKEVSFVDYDKLDVKASIVYFK